jgi:hypothetical protein
MKIAAAVASALCLVGVAAYLGATAFGAHAKAQRVVAVHRQHSVMPTAAAFGEALAATASITRTHCVEAKPGAYMCAYTLVRAGRLECHLMQGRWTPHASSTITVTLAGRTRRCGNLREAIHSLGR